jgi:hypothetical protein
MTSIKNEIISDSIALQLGLHYFSEFKTAADDLKKEQNIQPCKGHSF